MSFIKTTLRWVEDVEALADRDVKLLEAYRIVGERYGVGQHYVRDRVTVAKRVGYDILEMIQGNRELDNWRTLRRLGHKMKTKKQRLEFIRLFEMKAEYGRRNGRRETEHVQL